MGGQSIPDQDNPLSGEMAFEIPQELDELRVVVAVGDDVETQPGAPTAWPVADRARDGEPFPSERMAELWGRPAGAHVRRTGGRSDMPLSSSKTTQAARRLVFLHQLPGPALPPLDRLLVTFLGSERAAAGSTPVPS